MPVLRAKPQFRRGAVAREPLAVRAGHDPIPATVQEQGRRDHLRGVETPRGDGCQIVVYQPAAAVLRRRTDDADEPGPLGFERNEIGRHEPRSADEDAGAS